MGKTQVRLELQLDLTGTGLILMCNSPKTAFGSFAHDPSASLPEAAISGRTAEWLSAVTQHTSFLHVCEFRIRMLSILKAI